MERIRYSTHVLHRTREVPVINLFPYQIKEAEPIQFIGKMGQVITVPYYQAKLLMEVNTTMGKITAIKVLRFREEICLMDAKAIVEYLESHL